MSYRVVFTERARADIKRLLGSLADRSPEAAARLSARFEASRPRLEQFPLACGLAHENPLFAEEVRHLLFGLGRDRRYRALFTVRGDEVVILAVRAPGERPVRPQDLGTRGGEEAR